MSTIEAAVAANRFGLGARPGELERIAGDPGDWLAGQLRAERPAVLGGVGPERVARLVEARRGGAEGVLLTLRRTAREDYAADAEARTAHAVATPAPFVERMVRFWSNHFTVSAVRPVAASLAGPYEDEAIRPNVTGRFADLLLAATRHPAMLVFLDNAQSVGPASRAGRRRGRGLNENLARELLELHTVGVDAGYGQADVTALAAILTGWSIGTDGRFRYYRRIHEPGAKTVLGRRFAEEGEEEGLAALAMLAGHPATRRRLCAKLARQFAGAGAAGPLAGRLEEAWLAGDGDLGQVARALIDAAEAWRPEPARFKSPDELVVSTLRALGAEGAGRQAVASLGLQGQAPFMAPSPAGWPEDDGAWMTLEAVMLRVDWALAVADRVAPARNPAVLARDWLGPLASPATVSALEGASEPKEAMALLLLAPEFQRR
jgi:uncharacterized protein (DUF1800 family)